MTRTKHLSMIVDDAAQAYIFRCTVCRAELSLPRPVPLNCLFEASGTFIEKHQKCADEIRRPFDDLGETEA